MLNYDNPGNNPLKYIDFDGLEWQVTVQIGQYVVFAGGTEKYALPDTVETFTRTFNTEDAANEYIQDQIDIFTNNGTNDVSDPEPENYNNEEGTVIKCFFYTEYERNEYGRPIFIKPLWDKFAFLWWTKKEIKDEKDDQSEGENTESESTQNGINPTVDDENNDNSDSNGI